MRRVWKWFKRIVLGTIALAMIAVIVAIILLHTDWGREQVRKRVEAVLQGQFPGGAHIGKLSGSVFGTLTIEKLELDGADGKPLISVGQLEVRPALLPLLWKTVRVDSVIASDVVVDWRAQPSKPSAAKETAAPTKPAIVVPGFDAHGKPIVVASDASATPRSLASDSNGSEPLGGSPFAR